MSTENARKKMGRPRKDSEEVSVRIERADLDRIDQYAEREGLKGRPEAVRRLVRKALDTSDTIPVRDGVSGGA